MCVNSTCIGPGMLKPQTIVVNFDVTEMPFVISLIVVNPSRQKYEILNQNPYLIEDWCLISEVVALQFLR